MATLIRHPVSALGSGLTFSVTEMCFGHAGPLVLIQAGLHADECPPLLVAGQLVERLTTLEAAKRLKCRVQVITQANPIGGSQWLRGHHIGRIDLSSGRNFNRGMPHVAEQIVEELAKRLSADPESNRSMARALWHEALSGVVVESPVDALQVVLQSRAIDADWLLDLHSDDEAEPHIYAFPRQESWAMDLASRLGAATVLMAADSGTQTFDESVIGFWSTLNQAYPAAGFEDPVVAMTLELRGTRDVAKHLAEQDAEAVLCFLANQGLIDGPLQRAAPEVAVAVKPLSGMDPVTSPDSGLLVWHVGLGLECEAGTLLAELYRPDRPTAPALGIRARIGGRVIARRGHPWVRSGDVVVKMAGSHPLPWRMGDLLGGRR